MAAATSLPFRLRLSVVSGGSELTSARRGRRVSWARRSCGCGVKLMTALGWPVVCGELQVEGTAGGENPDWALRAGPRHK
ncbi:hypothetical protein ACFX1T_014382 [Malus domestica]